MRDAKTVCTCLSNSLEAQHHSRDCAIFREDLTNRIESAIQCKAYDLAHILLHSLAGVYQHTPKPVRARLLGPWKNRFSKIVTRCLNTCSQTK